LLILLFFSCFCAEAIEPKSKAFAFGDFISFDKRQKKRKQRKTLPRQGKPGNSLVKGFFYKTSMSCRKTLHIHVQRPPGLHTARWRWDLQKPRAKARARTRPNSRAHHAAVVGSPRTATYCAMAAAPGRRGSAAPSTPSSVLSRVWVLPMVSS